MGLIVDKSKKTANIQRRFIGPVECACERSGMYGALGSPRRLSDTLWERINKDGRVHISRIWKKGIELSEC